jgi:hypothetical protein
MDKSIFGEKDLKDIRERGIDPEEILKQVEIFRKGFSFVNILRPCRTGDGIKSLEENDISRLAEVYSKDQSAGRAMKFVPASGAATRMFKELISAKGLSENLHRHDLHVLANDNADLRCLLNFIEDASRFPFYNELKSLMAADGIDIEKAAAGDGYRDILEYALYGKGLNLANLPKALISFHKYKNYSRTPIEEHLVEAGAYTADGAGKARIHFTVSVEHEEAIKAHIGTAKVRYENRGMNFEIGFSNQKPSTDTIAVNNDNTLFREKDGSLVFRPGGHGALLENLNDLNGDIIFIKNIDNISPNRLKHTSTRYKKALAGFLVKLQHRIFSYLKRLESDDRDQALLNEILQFVREDLSIIPPAGIESLPASKMGKYLFERLNRPVRVGGMVRNQAEPGGGPFWVKHPEGGVSLQIVEKSQIDTSDVTQRTIMEESTHFNPVDLVCGVRDYRGAPFDLKKYVDPETFFISVKSKDGMELKALELPGLWNGAMAFWNTVFIEVPIITFNPVKTVFDLLRPEHQPGGNSDD